MLFHWLCALLTQLSLLKYILRLSCLWRPFNRATLTLLGLYSQIYFSSVSIAHGFPYCTWYAYFFIKFFVQHLVTCICEKCFVNTSYLLTYYGIPQTSFPVIHNTIILVIFKEFGIIKKLPEKGLAGEKSLARRGSTGVACYVWHIVCYSIA